MKLNKIILAYSGGLDTSVMLRWLKERYGCEVVCYCADVGQGEEMDGLEAKALETGASKLYIEDLREEFVHDYVFTAVKANAVYEGVYLMGTSLARPVIAKRQIEIAQREGADAVAHGATGKGNDQVRFELTYYALQPDIKVIAPWREWEFKGRSDLIAYAKEHRIPITATAEKPYSMDRNLMHISYEGGILEDPWAEPPEEVYAWTTRPNGSAAEPTYLEISFERGVPVALDGEEMDGVALIETLNRLAGSYGIGRIDHIENRLVGIKSREVYEAPAAAVLHSAHRALESLTLSRDQARFKEVVAGEYARLIYNGQWYSALHQDLAAYVQSTQRFVSGVVRVKLSPWHCAVVGRKSEHSLYNHSLATYDSGDQFDHNAALGFIKLWGLPLTTQAQAQLLPAVGVEGNLLQEPVGKEIGAIADTKR